MVGDWLVSAAQARAHGGPASPTAVRRAADGLSPAAAARDLAIPDADLVPALVAPSGATQRGRLVVEADLPPAVREALDALRDDLAGTPFAAPDAERLAALGLDRDDRGPARPRRAPAGGR